MARSLDDARRWVARGHQAASRRRPGRRTTTSRRRLALPGWTRAAPRRPRRRERRGAGQPRALGGHGRADPDVRSPDAAGGRHRARAAAHAGGGARPPGSRSLRREPSSARWTPSPTTSGEHEVVTAQGRDRARLRDPVDARPRGVVHAVDLDPGVTFADLPDRLPRGPRAPTCSRSAARARRHRPLAGRAAYLTGAPTARPPACWRSTAPRPELPRGSDHERADKEILMSTRHHARRRRRRWRHRRARCRARACPDRGCAFACSSRHRSSARSARACRSRRTAPGSWTSTGCSTRPSGSACCPTSMVMRDAVDGARADPARPASTSSGATASRTWSSTAATCTGILLRACQRAGVDLLTDQRVVGYANTADGRRGRAAPTATSRRRAVVIAADGLHSVARRLLVDDEPVSSAYVAYRGAVPIDHGRGERPLRDRRRRLRRTALPLRPLRACAAARCSTRSRSSSRPRRSPARRTGALPTSSTRPSPHTCEQVREGIPLMWRDRWWRMYDRDPIQNWVHGRIALLGDAAHPPLQYMAQGAIMAIEDGWVLAEHVGAQQPDPHGTGSGVDWDAALAAYNAVRPAHCARVVTDRPVMGRAVAPRRPPAPAAQRAAARRATPTTTPSWTGSTDPPR